MVNAALYDVHDYKLSEVQFACPHDDVVVVAYRVRCDMTVDGERLTVDAFDASHLAVRKVSLGHHRHELFRHFLLGGVVHSDLLAENQMSTEVSRAVRVAHVSSRVTTYCKLHARPC